MLAWHKTSGSLCFISLMHLPAATALSQSHPGPQSWSSCVRVLYRQTLSSQNVGEHLFHIAGCHRTQRQRQVIGLCQPQLVAPGLDCFYAHALALTRTGTIGPIRRRRGAEGGGLHALQRARRRRNAGEQSWWLRSKRIEAGGARSGSSRNWWSSSGVYCPFSHLLVSSQRNLSAHTDHTPRNCTQTMRSGDLTWSV
jgi:hypothetical protein